MSKETESPREEPVPPEEPGQTPETDQPPVTPRENPETDQEKVEEAEEERDRVVGN